ncbi:MAG TPA: hypothetical protein VGV39_04605 [Mesorhizobium sp.]|jgi:hypothetical protein|uniref:hypothetical protein n=1 Tax=Mesorhizobium sp. TaxID=1871066 RepID=UPI002DDCFB66|nr:hypothetical protein [Mesorhizobium sp.]HEV2502329.1 hypothetical protein [Mesorhizobium sp.]
MPAEQVVTEIQITSAQTEAALARIEQAYAHVGDRAAAAEARAQAALDKTVQSLTRVPQSIDRVQAAYDKVRGSIDPVVNAQIRAEQEMTRSLSAINRAVLLGVTTEQQAAREIAGLRSKQVAEINRVRDAQEKLNDSARAANDNNPAFRRQNLGYQAFDIGQGLAAGTPLAVILAQQGPQIAQLYAMQGGLNALWQDAVSILGALARAAAPWIAAAALIYGAYRLIKSSSAEAALAIDDTTAALAKQAAPIGSVKSMVSDLYSIQKDYTNAISATARTQTAATATIIANSEKEFNAKKSLLELELKRQQAAIAAQQAEIAIAGLQMKREVGQQVFTRMDTERTGFSDPRIGRFVNLPDDITGLEKTREVLEKSPANETIKELRANLSLTEVGVKALQDALKTTFDSTTVKPEKMSAGAARAYRDLMKNADDRLAQMQVEIDSVGKVGIEADKLAFRQRLLSDATDHGRKIGEEQRKEIEKRVQKFEELATKLATVRLQQDLLFERQQAFRNPIDQRIASELQQRGLPIDFNSEAAAAIRYNEQLYIARDLTFDFASTLAQDLRNGVKPIEALTNAFGRLGDKLLDMALNNAINSLFANLAGGGSGGSGSGGGGWLGSLFSWLGFANGGAFGASGLTAFANGGAFTNSIVSSPTLFKFANGTGLMGEAGPEAIMPLRRTSSGALGVMAANQNGGTVVQIIDQRSGGAPVSTEEGLGPNGERQVRVIIRDALERYDGELPMKIEGKVDAMQQNPRRRGGGW